MASCRCRTIGRRAFWLLQPRAPGRNATRLRQHHGGTERGCECLYEGPSLDEVGAHCAVSAKGKGLAVQSLLADLPAPQLVQTAGVRGRSLLSKRVDFTC